MNDGGGESGRENENDGSSSRRKSSGGGGDDYCRAITRIAISQICESVGFQSIQQSALETLSQVAILYLRDLGKTAHFYTNLAGRMECNVFDIIQGLEDLVSSQGFLGASDVNHCIAGSGTVREIMHYVSLDEIPFARRVTHIPLIRNRKPTTSFLQIGKTPDEEHIPAWLPAFPDPNTYVDRPKWSERMTDPHRDKLELERQQRKAEQSLFSLQQQRLICNGSSASTSVDPGNDGKAKQAAESNPFLAPPLGFGEIDVSPIVPPAKLANEPLVVYRGSGLETFAPPVETTNNRQSDSRNDEKSILPNKRPIVKFKLGAAKKSLVAPLVLTLEKNNLEETSHLLGKDDEKDCKKRRAEQILKDSMENSQEHAQL